MSVDPPAPGTPMSERMQSLLSRAVEDQLSEQRQLATALTDLRAQLQRVGDEVTQLRASAGSGGGSEQAVHAVAADVREAVRLLAERIDGVASLVQQRGSDLAELKAQTADLHATVRTHGEALSGISGGLGVDALQQRVEGVDQGLRELRSAFSAVGARMADVPSRADFDALAQRTTEPVNALAAQLTRIETSVAHLASAQEDPGARDSLREELARFAETMTTGASRHEERLQGLEAQLRTLGGHVEAQRSTLAEAVAPDPAADDARREVADLRNELLGPGGLAARLESAVAQRPNDDVQGQVAAAVADATAGLEQRLTAHVDEAVLALAEALLRRRARPATPLASAFDTGPIPVVPPAAPEPPRAPEPTSAPEPPSSYAEPEPTSSYREPVAAPPESAQAEPAQAEPAQSEHAEPEPAEQETQAIALPDATTAEQVRSEPAAHQWQRDDVEAVADSTAGSTAGGHGDDASRRRRPWWRPGD